MGSELAPRVPRAIYKTFAEGGRPQPVAIAHQLRLSPDDVHQAMHDLQEAHAIMLDPETGEPCARGNTLGARPARFADAAPGVRNMFRPCAVVVLLLVVATSHAAAQSFEAGAHFSSARWSEFDGADNGFGGRLTWKPSELIGVDAEFTWYPSDFAEGIAFTRSRVEGLFGATIGPRIDRVRPFAKLAAGFLKIGATPGAFACIAIFPPPLSCALAGGDTLPAFEIGGGLAVDMTDRTFVRVDIADRILKYPGPTFDSNFERRDEGFLGHAVRFTLGAGIRF